MRNDAVTRKLVATMPVEQTLPQVSQSRKRRRSDRRFFEALETCVGNPKLAPRPRYYYSSDSPTALVVQFGHLYPDNASKAARQQVESSVMFHIMETYSSQLAALDPQRLGTATAAFDLHFKEQFLGDKQSLRDRGELPIDMFGQQRSLPTSLKVAKSAPMFAQIVVKQLDFRWTAQGATSALLAAAGYGKDVTVNTEFAGELPAHLDYASPVKADIKLGRSDTIVAQVTAPASDPSLRKLPRSIQFQGHTLIISVSRSLHSKTEQRKSRQPDALLKQQRRRRKMMRRRVKKSQALLGLAQDIDVTVKEAAVELTASDLAVDMGQASTSGREHDDPAVVVPSAGRKRDLESHSGSDSEPALASDSEALAIVPVTPDDDHGEGVRRSSREHKKPKPYYELATAVESVPRAKSGLKAGFLN